MNRFGLALACVAAALATPLAAQTPGPADGPEVLAYQLTQAESLRAVKRLEVSQAQLIQYGLWSNVDELYSADAEGIFGDRQVRGPAAIRAQWQALLGNLPEGPKEGALSVELAMTPVVTMESDGVRAKGRWHVVTMSGSLGGDAQWHGGIMENEYRREGGVWRISKVHYYPQFEGPYDTGWTNVTDDLGIVPYHYTPAQAGTPIPRASGSAANADIDRASVAERIAALNAEDEVRNLQNVYGYYVDRKMWDDVGDLFEEDGTLQIAGVGRWIGAASIRRGLERDGPPNLGEGQVNDRVQVNMTVDMQPGGDVAHVRGLEFGMIGQNGGDAFWTIATFENDFVRRDGKWRIARMRLYPQMRTDYYKGWAKSWLPEPVPAAAYAPDEPVPALTGTQFPAFRSPHPTTGKDVAYPNGAAPVQTANPAVAAAAAKPLPDQSWRQLRMSVGYDATENLSSALGNWLDDFEWANLAELFTADGIRLSPAAGYYIGRDRIRTIQDARYGPLKHPRRSIPMHLRIQPVIDFEAGSDEGLLQTRLLQFNSAFGRPGSMTAGLYNDAVRLEDGVWKFSEVLVRHIWRSPGYAAGWARVPDDIGRTAAPSPDKLLQQFPPDRPLVEDGIAPFPKIGPVCYHYANPVTGRRSASSPSGGCHAPDGS